MHGSRAAIFEHSAGAVTARGSRGRWAGCPKRCGAWLARDTVAATLAHAIGTGKLRDSNANAATLHLAVECMQRPRWAAASETGAGCAVSGLKRVDKRLWHRLLTCDLASNTNFFPDFVRIIMNC